MKKKKKKMVDINIHTKIINCEKLRDNFEQFIRNGRWGTCGYCKRSDGKVYPEFCENTERYDHNLSIEDLVDIYKISFNRWKK